MGDPEQHRRSAARVNVGPGHSLGFQYANRSFAPLPLANLSLSGCCVRIPARLADYLAKGCTLEEVQVRILQVQSPPMRARVVWILGGQSLDPEAVLLMGIEFMAMEPEFEKKLQFHLRRLLPPGS